MPAPHTSNSGAAALFAGLDEPCERPRVSLLYLFGLLIVALAMILLPVVYVGLIGCVGYGVYYYAVHNIGILHSGAQYVRGRGVILALLLYAAPMVVGGILLFFMIKPLFARPARELSPLAFDRQQQPLLYDFLARLCAAIGAPLPRQIKVDCDVNASASFRRGWLSFFGNDMVLTIGLPLMAGLSVRQFAGVLAHELGHFSQGMGMRLTYVIRSVNAWFARVVYERDVWDYTLMEASREEDARIAILLLVARMFIWVTRMILWVLMMIGHGISCFMLRQMEYDADRYNALVAGSDGFEATVHRINVLGAATAGAYSQLRDSWAVRRLPDNLPGFIMARAANLPPPLRTALREDAQKRRTGIFDTHPSDRDRIQNVARYADRGIINHDAPASTLIGDFDTVCRTISLVFYSDQLGQHFQREHLVPTTSMLGAHGEVQEDLAALARYFRPEPRLVRPLLPKSDELLPVRDPKRTLASLKEVHRRLSAVVGKVAIALQRFDDADSALIDACRAAALCKAGVRFDPKDLRLEEASAAAAERKQSAALASQRSVSALLDAYDSAMRTRLLCGLGLLGVPSVATRIENAEDLHSEAKKLVAIWARLRSAVATLAEPRRDLALLSMLLKLQAQAESNTTLAAMVRTTTSRMHGVLANLRSALERLPYPFEHSGEGLSVGRYLVEKLPPEGEPMAVGPVADWAGERAASLYLRLLGRLARTAEKVEAVIGLPPLPDPSAVPVSTDATVPGPAKAAPDQARAEMRAQRIHESAPQ
jgi:Zn-dependent protease with chaperone function